MNTTCAIGMLADTSGRFEILPAESGAGTPLVWVEGGDLAWGYFGGRPEAAPETAWVRRLVAEPELARELSGVFGLVAADRAAGRVLAVGDRLGVQGIHYGRGGDGTWRVSTHLMWLLRDLRHDGAVDEEGFLAHLGFGYTGRPVYRGVEKLRPAGHAVWDGRGISQTTYWEPPRAVEEPTPERLDQLAETLPAQAPAESVLGVTSGKDSLCLAAAMAGGPPGLTGTFGVEGCADHLQGREISARLGSRHLTAEVCGAEEFPCWASQVAFHSAGLATASYVDMAAFVGRTIPPGHAFIMGEGGECVRQFFGVDPLATLTGRYMTPAEYLCPTLAAPVNGYPGRLVAAVREPLGAIDDAGFGVVFYRSQRMPGNFSQRHAVLGALRPKLSPFLDRRFVEAAYGLRPQNSRVHRALLERLRPGFLRWFDRPAQAPVTVQDWERRFAGGVGEQTGRMLEEALPFCGDALRADGVRALCAAAIARPSRAIYHLFRVLSFARARQMLREGMVPA